MIKPSTQRLIVILGSFVLATASIYVLLSLISPSYADIQLLRAQRQGKIDLYNAQSDAKNKIDDLLKAYSTLATVQEEILSPMLPTDPGDSSLLNQIQAIARNNNIALSSLSFQYPPIKPSASEILKGVGSIAVGLNMNGTYQNFKSMLSQLETNVRIMDVTSLKIDGGATVGKTVLNYSLVVNAYYQPGDEAFPQIN